MYNIMAVEVRKRDNESSESLIRRFSRSVQQAGVLLQARKIRYYERKKSFYDKMLAQERDRLIKLGEIDEFTMFSQPRSGRR